MTQHEAMEALSRQTGMRLAFNDNGLCRLRFDGRFIVDMEVADDETAIYLYSRLGQLPAAEHGGGKAQTGWRGLFQIIDAEADFSAP